MNLFALFDRPDLDGGAPLIARPGRSPITYCHAFAMARCVADALIKLELRPGDRVAVRVEKSGEAAFFNLCCPARRSYFLAAEHRLQAG